MDWLGFVLQGVFTGIGTAVGMRIYDKHLNDRLDEIERKIGVANERNSKEAEQSL